VHAAVNMLHGRCFKGGHAYHPSHLRDAAMLGAATLAAVSADAVSQLRSGMQRHCDAVDVVCVLGDASHLLHHFYDGNLYSGARGALKDFGANRIRCGGGYSFLGRFDPEAVVRVPRSVTADVVQASSRARVAAAMALLDERAMREVFQGRLELLPSLSFDVFMGSVARIMRVLMQAEHRGRGWDASSSGIRRWDAALSSHLPIRRWRGSPSSRRRGRTRRPCSDWSTVWGRARKPAYWPAKCQCTLAGGDAYELIHG